MTVSVSPGYWNFTVENPDGCQLCTCSPLGTLDNGGGCNEQTGECACKANVARTRDCDQCLPEHYGLSESDPNGCKACDCDPGGAYNNNCDVVTGQCLCRPNIKVGTKPRSFTVHLVCNDHDRWVVLIF